MSITPDNCIHLTVEIVDEIHDAVLSEFGGSPGVRDEHLLASAVAAPSASFGGASPFSDLIEVAAAYLFYICQNHPFIDGNKRAAMASAIVFLKLNGVDPAPDSDEWESLVLAVASGAVDRAQATELLRKLLRKKKRAR